MPLTKDKYFELIDSNSDYPHFRCALGAYIPGSLYKYFSIPDDSDEARKRFEQLKSGEIWFSKRSGLNDPFEFEHIALMHDNIILISSRSWKYAVFRLYFITNLCGRIMLPVIRDTV